MGRNYSRCLFMEKEFKVYEISCNLQLQADSSGSSVDPVGAEEPMGVEESAEGSHDGNKSQDNQERSNAPPPKR